MERMQEEMRTVPPKQLKVLVSRVLQVSKDFPALSQLDDLLEPQLPVSLMDMNRISLKNSRPNEEFTVMLKHKLRLPIWVSTMLALLMWKNHGCICMVVTS